MMTMMSLVRTPCLALLLMLPPLLAAPPARAHAWPQKSRPAQEQAALGELATLARDGWSLEQSNDGPYRGALSPQAVEGRRQQIEQALHRYESQIDYRSQAWDGSIQSWFAYAGCMAGMVCQTTSGINHLVHGNFGMALLQSLLVWSYWKWSWPLVRDTSSSQPQSQSKMRPIVHTMSLLTFGLAILGVAGNPQEWKQWIDATPVLASIISLHKRHQIVGWYDNRIERSRHWKRLRRKFDDIWKSLQQQGLTEQQILWAKRNVAWTLLASGKLKSCASPLQSPEELVQDLVQLKLRIDAGGALDSSTGALPGSGAEAMEADTDAAMAPQTATTALRVKRAR